MTAIAIRRIGFALAVAAGFSTAASVSAQTVQSRAVVISELKHDISPVLRDIGVRAALPSARPQLSDPDEMPPSLLAPMAATSDSVVQRASLAQVGTTTTLSFDGLASNGYAVPDGNGSVGATQFVEATNNQYAVYSKTSGLLVLGPVALNSVWTGFGGMCESGGTYYDPIVLYDKAAGRWFLSQFVENSTLTSFLECIAVSTTSDATGSYARYSFSSGTTLNDYPKFSVWSDAYYGSYNSYTNAGTTFVGARVCAYNRTAMLAGTTAKAVCFQRSTADWNLLPADLDGSTQPPAGAPGYYAEIPTPLPSTVINLFQFHVDFTKPINSTFTGPTAVPIASWVRLCNSIISCIPQPSPGEKVDGNAYRLMYRLAYRNFGDHEALVASHTVDSGSGIAGVRWYEIRSPQSAPFVFQQGTYAKPATHLWMGTITMDKLGDIAIGMNGSSSTLKPSVVFTGRVPADPLGTMESSRTATVGTGVQTNDANRWGDYSSIAIDPVDDCTFWYTSQYYKTNGSLWNTRVVAFKFTGCN